MGRLTDISFRHPDKTLSLIGAVGGATLGIAHLDAVGAVLTALTSGLFTLLIANLNPHDDPAYGPHQ